MQLYQSHLFTLSPVRHSLAITTLSLLLHLQVSAPPCIHKQVAEISMPSCCHAIHRKDMHGHHCLVLNTMSFCSVSTCSATHKGAAACSAAPRRMARHYAGGSHVASMAVVRRLCKWRGIIVCNARETGAVKKGYFSKIFLSKVYYLNLF
jgi:hypothetical protein